MGSTEYDIVTRNANVRGGIAGPYLLVVVVVVLPRRFKAIKQKSFSKHSHLVFSESGEDGGGGGGYCRRMYIRRGGMGTEGEGKEIRNTFRKIHCSTAAAAAAVLNTRAHTLFV